MKFKLIDAEACKCSRIRLVQAVRREKRNSKGEYVPKEKIPGRRSDISDQSSGWAMDWPKGFERDRPPYWDELPLSTPAPGTGNGDGTYWDPPGLSTLGEGFRALTCFVAERAGGSEVIGCVEWGFSFESRGSNWKDGGQRRPYEAKILPGTPKNHCGVPPGLKDGINAWNNTVDENAKLKL